MCNSFAAVNRFKELKKKGFDEPAAYSGMNKTEAEKIIASVKGRKVLTEDTASRVLKAYGLPVADSGLAGSVFSGQPDNTTFALIDLRKHVSDAN